MPLDVSSQNSSIISKIASMSASVTGDFLRLAFNLFNRSAASGKSTLAVTDFCFRTATSARAAASSARVWLRDSSLSQHSSSTSFL